MITCPVTIKSGVTATAAPGTVFKAAAGESIEVDGTFMSAGTAANPVTFTALADDTVGGNTDGTTTSPADNLWGGLMAESGGSASLSHTTLRYAETAASSDTGGTMAVTDSRFEQDMVGALLDDDHPLLQRNVAVGITVRPYAVVSDHLDFSRISGNTSSGGAEGLQLLGTISTSGSFPAGTTIINSGLTIPAGITVTAPAGQVIKSIDGAEFDVYGTLTGTGTATSPITFTSFGDDSVGGDSNVGDASSDDLQWDGLDAFGSSKVTLAYATLRNARRAINVNVNAKVAATHSRFTSDTIGIAAPPCSGGESNCVAVDARNSYWGAASGPAPTGTGTPIVGAVTFVPFATS